MNMASVWLYLLDRFGLPVREESAPTRTFPLAKWPYGSADYPTGFE